MGLVVVMVTVNGGANEPRVGNPIERLGVEPGPQLQQGIAAGANEEGPWAQTGWSLARVTQQGLHPAYLRRSMTGRHTPNRSEAR
jgi:hypothetical protein